MMTITLDGVSGSSITPNCSFIFFKLTHEFISLLDCMELMMKISS